MDFFNNLTKSEQKTILWAMAVLCFILVFLLLIEPIKNKNDKAQLRLKSEQILRQYMQKSAKSLVKQNKLGKNNSNPSNITPYILLDKNIKQLGLANPTAMIPKGQKGITFKYDAIAFDALMQLLQNLQNKGLYLKQLNTKKIAKGMVSASIRLEQ